MRASRYHPRRAKPPDLVAPTRDGTTSAGPALAAFVVISAAHLVSLAAGVTWIEWATKSLLMASLAQWVMSTYIVAQYLLASGAVGSSTKETVWPSS